MIIKKKMVMKQMCVLLFSLFVCNVGIMSAQGRKFRFELGFNNPIGLQKMDMKKSMLEYI